MINTIKAKRIIKTAVSLFILTFFTTVFFLYALGYYDFTFITRPTPNPTPQYLGEVTTDISQDTEPDDTTDTTSDDDWINSGSSNTGKTIDTTIKINLPAAGTLTADGYYVTNTVYSADTHKIAKLVEFDAGTTAYSLRTRTVQKQQTEAEYEDGPLTAVTVEVTENRPAVESYMGYLMVDNGSTTSFLNPYGTWLLDIDTDKYIPAYTRDTSGNPLFRTTLSRELYYTEDGSDYAYLEKYNYYSINSYRGSYSIGGNGYNDVTDNRGIYMDYPATYGITDNTSRQRYCTYFPCVETTLSGDLIAFLRTEWILHTGDIESPLTEDKYYSFLPFSNGYACVTDKEGIQYFISTNGNKTFETKIDFYNKQMGNWRMISEFLMPEVKDESVLGFYYYDSHGLVRARKRMYDYYQLIKYKKYQLTSDTDILIYTDGTEFPVPSGYDVISYSDGIIQLKSSSGLYGYMDYTGKWLISPNLEDASFFMEGLAVVKTGGKYGIIDTSGNVVIPFEYDSIEDSSSGVIVCWSEASGWNVFLKMTK